MFLKLVGLNSLSRAEFANPVRRGQIIEVNDPKLQEALLADGRYTGEEGDDDNFTHFWQEVEDPRTGRNTTRRGGNRLTRPVAKDAVETKVVDQTGTAADTTDETEDPDAEADTDADTATDDADGTQAAAKAAAKTAAAKAPAQRRSR